LWGRLQRGGGWCHRHELIFVTVLLDGRLARRTPHVVCLGGQIVVLSLSRSSEGLLLVAAASSSQSCAHRGGGHAHGPCAAAGYMVVESKSSEAECV
jgi:hypothetical protein